MKRGRNQISAYDSGMSGPQDLKPCVEMEEQPQPHSIRFRYASEGNSHGGLQGVSSQRGNKTYPTIVIRNHHGPVKIVVELIAKDAKTRIQPHAHELIGKGCSYGVYSWKHMVDSPNCQIVFKHLSVQHVTKKNLIETLQRRLLMQRNNFLDGYEPTAAELESVRQEAVDLSKKLPMNSARLCFRVYLLDKHDQPIRQLEPAISDPIFDAKSPSAALLKICRIDRHAGGCQGGDEVFLLCDRVQKVHTLAGDIDVEFYEYVDEEIVWLEKANFTANDIHRQFAIVFTTPAYKDQTIEHPVDVFIRLFRPSDEEMSDPVKFTYRPNMERDELDRKRRKTLNFDLPPDGMDDDSKPFRGTRKSAQSTLNLPTDFMSRDSGDVGVSRLQRRALPSDVESDALPVLDFSENDGQTELDPDSIAIPSERKASGIVDVVDSPAIRNDESAQTNNKSARDLTNRISDTNNSDDIVERAKLKIRKQFDAVYHLLGEALNHYAISGNIRSMLCNLSKYLDYTNDDGDSPIGMAIIHGRVEAAVNLAEVAAALVPRCLYHTNKLGQSLLHLCVIAKRHEILRYLLGQRRKKNNPCGLMDLPLSAQDIAGNTFLHTAVRHKNIPALKALRSHLDLLRHDNKYDDTWLDVLNNEGFSALHLAVRSGDLDVVETVCGLNPDVNGRDQRSGFTPLHHAVVWNNFALAACLLGQPSIDVNMTCHRHQTPLHYTCWMNNPAMASLLLAGDADPTMRAPCLTEDVESESGQLVTPLMIAMQQHYTDLQSVLKKADISKVDAIEVKIDDDEGDLSRLLYTGRHHLSSMLMTSYDDNDDDEWKVLADKLQLGKMVPFLQVSNEPVVALLDSYEVEGGKLADLYKSLLEMERFDMAYFLSCEFPEL